MDQLHYYYPTGEDDGDDLTNPRNNQKDLYTQLVISGCLGLSAFLTFAVLRPRWSSLYAARKKQRATASSLPDLPDTLFGWIPVLYRISEKEVLTAAGLDAWVFLQFFKMAIKFLAIAAVLSASVLMPIHSHFSDDDEVVKPKESARDPQSLQMMMVNPLVKAGKGKNEYLWAHLIFVYLFSGLSFYFLYAYTLSVIRVRQDYLGHQCTITDRTIRLSAIPHEMRSEQAIKNHVEGMGIGTVDSVTICRNWKIIDDLMEQRDTLVRKLEEAWAVYLSRKGIQSSMETLPIAQPDPPSTQMATGDEEPLLNGRGRLRYNKKRPQITLRHFSFQYFLPKLNSKKVDAIDYYTMKLETLDGKIEKTRKEEFRALPLAFVTLNSVAAAQMAVQAVLDPKPAEFVARPAPAPSNIIWRNTYMPRYKRMLRSWLISIFIFVLSVFWLIPVGILAGLLNIRSIHKVWPQLADLLERSALANSLVSNFLPTAILTLLNVAVPYLYDYLSNLQGMISQADVELSVISKNFFFTFFNLFFAFSVFGTASNMYSVLKDTLKDTTHIAYLLAQSLQALAPFYINLIVLQGIGMFPFRLLDFGTVALYPVTLAGAKTPRDFAKLHQPSIFSYGFYLPQPILILILCIVYSVLPSGTLVLAFGLVYFLIGYFVHKYQLLYAMDHPQHSTGQAWSMITYRLLIGIVLFQSAMAGWLALRLAFVRALLIVPLIAFTLWFAWFYRKTFSSLNRYIALRAIADDTGGAGTRSPRDPERAVTEMTVDERREQGLEFINPNLIVPLSDVWVKTIARDYSSRESGRME
ncbi:DUF221-domain-containing protein [Terfezia boudieri ATCC MYA-4762]|uniref:DUF221-domain-containing protein n=1 Tax=Terfezia boudieri ATCC MYA-4762 TaxID=1051890 RepID=A0A3N4LPQ5_9PEZI|nr:DUF221-domain-containing protein [Terfezia boudieri ATCC MYA-4762]